MWAIGNPMLSELLFAFLSAIAVYLLAHLYRLRPHSTFATVALTIAAWFVLAASALAKTTGLAVAGAMFVGIAFGFHSWSMKRRIAVLILSALVFAVGLAPWVLKFKEHTGYYGFTDNGFMSVQHGLERFPHFPLGLELEERSPQWHSYGDIWADVRDVAAADPAGALHLLGIKIVCPWYATWTGRFDRYLFVVQFPWFLLFALASARALARWKRIPGSVILLHGYVAALWFAAALVAPILRYLLPGFPFVVIVVLWHAVDAGLLGQNAGELGKSAGECTSDSGKAPSPR